MSSLYIYGLARAEERPEAASLGTGLSGAALEWVAEGGLAALVSDSPAEHITPTRRSMLTHTAVLERAQQQRAMLPVRFGTVAPDAATLRQCLNGNAATLSAALSSIAGRVELGVKANWREDVAFAQLLEEDAGLRRLRDRLRSRPAAETYAERIELGRKVEAALAARRQADSAAILARLAPLAERETALKQLDETMILNHAFLVPRSHEAEFDAAMSALAAEHAARIDFRYVGPVPPYNFVTLHADLFGRA
ncbi:GvpL/GvpF family gas vesicle protein [Teichococcus aestuarii]|uniref:GvpL/GvpF family gas vesicle protein n=1 Tax=Teichococcus aestuarii TaxID=568898 RepID=UPI00361BC8D6